MLGMFSRVPCGFKDFLLGEKFICDALRDLLPFVQYKKHEQHLCSSDTFGIGSMKPEILSNKHFSDTPKSNFSYE